jgi:GT2 family glycosyltransferase
VGDALYRLHPGEGPVDTVPFGSFRRTLIDRIGAFDETLLANEDYEFNTRVRNSGGTVFLDPTIRSVYFSRSTLGMLASQYWRYGFWKFRMLRKYPRTLRWRQALPPAFVLNLMLLSVLSLFAVWARYFFAIQVFSYFFVLGLAGLKLAFEKGRISLLIGLPLAIMTMHFSWGGGFLWSGISSLFPANKNG